MQQVGKLALPGGPFGRARGFAVQIAAMDRPSFGLRAVGLRKKREIDALPDEFQKVGPARFDKSGAQKNVVVDVIDAHGQLPQGKLRRHRASGSLAQDSPPRAWRCAQP